MRTPSRSGRDLGVDAACRVIQLSPSTYFVRERRPKSARRLRDKQLMALMEQIHADSGGTYGTHRGRAGMHHHHSAGLADFCRVLLDELRAPARSRLGVPDGSRAG
ncbi:hypothetical protein [Streptomyces sp. TRM49041]|uniref:hypothetical protein n=1 Tax=Streptomyces sp. TRM49041 TaxID=2603216 RepID=UPI0011EDA655|nr:hypothetical protein [Streptomyces sp. TRM49041]